MAGLDYMYSVKEHDVLEKGGLALPCSRKGMQGLE